MINNIRRPLSICTAIIVLSGCNSGNSSCEAYVNGCATVMEYDWMIGPWVKRTDVNPCLKPDPSFVFMDPILGKEVRWQELNAYNPAAIVKDDKVYLFFRAEDTIGKYHGTSRIGLAVSEDGYTFTSYPKPVIYPDNDEFKEIEWEGGCEDPRIVESENGVYYMYYTSYNGADVHLCCAESMDLINWKKHGPIFGKALKGKYSDIWSKSGAVVCRQERDHFYPVRIKGKYWMYWGESSIYAATSEDLVDWIPVEFLCEGPAIPQKKISVVDYEGKESPYDDIKTLFPVASPRIPGYDEILCEPGPQAVLTDRGIILIYNGFGHDIASSARVYAGEQLLLDKDDPTAVIARTTRPFITVSEPYDVWRFAPDHQSGNVFQENMVYFNGRYIMYYGAADHEVAIAETGPVPLD